MPVWCHLLAVTPLPAQTAAVMIKQMRFTTPATIGNGIVHARQLASCMKPIAVPAHFAPQGVKPTLISLTA